MPLYPKKSGGSLDGLTILRFSHAYETGGGIEQHLALLNSELSKRNRLTTIQMQLTADPARLEMSEERIGDSLLIKIPLFARQARVVTDSSGSPKRLLLLKSLCGLALNHLLCTPSRNDFAVRHLLRWRRVPQRPGEPEGVGAKAAHLIERFRVDLLVLHANGGADVSEIIEVANSADIPVAMVHHFSNERLATVSLRQQISRSMGVGGVSGVNVPTYLRRYFFNLSNAVDTEFFRPEKVRHLFPKPSGLVLYAPARVTPEKGQADVIEVASILKSRGIETAIVFAGRIDSPSFELHLRQLAAQKGLTHAIHFLGPLGQEDYRDWYGAAFAMVMPTRHHEGMPRTVIESQAMKVPPLVYDAGGTREGIKDKVTGFLLQPGDLLGIVDAVATLIANPDLHRRMAEAGRQFVESAFSMQAFAERHERFYHHVLSRGKEGSLKSRPAACRVRNCH